MAIITDFGNFIDEIIIDEKKYKYEDGIMDIPSFSSAPIKILWILKETHGPFNIKKWWGDQKYLQWKNITPFDGEPGANGQRKVGTKKSTWEPVAKISYQILNGKKTDDKFELAKALKQIAVINLRKTFGKKHTTKEFYEDIKKPENRLIFLEQIRKINPDVIICGNTLNFIHNDEIAYRNKRERHYLSEFSKDKEKMKNNSYFCFKNKLFINPYHPSYVMNKDEYVDIVVEAYNNWLSIRNSDDCPVFEW
ncbi:MAG: hypothetical protein K5829_08370 [Treponema sp.]|nr:hypothetical protein [Treponema sp.]